MTSDEPELWSRSGPTSMWQLAPGWVNWFISLGFKVGSLQPEIQPTITFVTVPTRVFASPLLAAGCVTAQVRQRAGLGEHIERLRALPVGTLVTHRPNGKGDKHYKAKFLGFKEIEGEERIVVKWLKPSEKRSVRLPFAQAIQIVDDQDRDDGTGGSQKVVIPTPFALGLAGPEHYANLSIGVSCDCILVGEKWILSEELEDVAFAVPSPEGVIDGALQDIVGERHLCKPGQASRSRILSSRVSPRGGVTRTKVALFDGASGFFRWRGALPGSHWIVVLDRTETRFQEAVDLQAELYARRRNEDGEDLSLGRVPSGIEAVTFTRGA